LFECVATSLLTCDSITKIKAICACTFVLVFYFPWCLDLIKSFFLFRSWSFECWRNNKVNTWLKTCKSILFWYLKALVFKRLYKTSWRL
jgi:hypothetical protein